jgi:hypothetical protein
VTFSFKSGVPGKSGQESHLLQQNNKTTITSVCLKYEYKLWNSEEVTKPKYKITMHRHSGTHHSNLSTQEAGAGESWVLGQPGLHRTLC